MQKTDFYRWGQRPGGDITRAASAYISTLGFAVLLLRKIVLVYHKWNRLELNTKLRYCWELSFLFQFSTLAKKNSKNIYMDVALLNKAPVARE